MASVHSTILILLSVYLTLQTGLGHPVADGPGASDSKDAPRVRSKRCSCTNQLDSECHYYCHLDIIWVNTPSKTTVYGLGSPITRRRRRSAGRCVCANPADLNCNRFCLYSSENPAIVLVKPSQSEEEEKRTDTDSSVLTIQKTPQAPRADMLIPQRPMGEVNSELLALIRELIRSNSLDTERVSPPKKKAPWVLKAAYR